MVEMLEMHPQSKEESILFKDYLDKE